MHDSAFATDPSQKEAVVCSPESVRDRIISIPNTAGAARLYGYLMRNLSSKMNEFVLITLILFISG